MQQHLLILNNAIVPLSNPSRICDDVMTQMHDSVPSNFSSFERNAIILSRFPSIIFTSALLFWNFQIFQRRISIFENIEKNIFIKLYYREIFLSNLYCEFAFIK